MASKAIVILIEREFALEYGDINTCILQHPKGCPVLYLQIKDCILELQTIQPFKYGSWFVDQRICSDPYFYAATKIDPRFLILPSLQKNATRFSPLDQIVENREGCSRLLPSDIEKWDLHEICDKNDKLGDIMLYRFNESKMMDWLKSKVIRTVDVLVNHRRKRESRKNQLFAEGFNASAQTTASITHPSMSISEGTSSGDAGEGESMNYYRMNEVKSLSHSSLSRVQRGFDTRGAYRRRLLV